MKNVIDPATYPHPILLYDGVCNFCNDAVQFIIKRDKTGIIHYASLQSTTGQQLLEHFHLSKDLDTVILIDDNRVYDRADVTIRIGQLLGGVYQFTNLFRPIPRVLRNRVYDWIATNRYRWFGKEASCMLPTPELKARFIDV